MFVFRFAVAELSQIALRNQLSKSSESAKILFSPQHHRFLFWLFLLLFALPVCVQARKGNHEHAAEQRVCFQLYPCVLQRGERIVKRGLVEGGKFRSRDVRDVCHVCQVHYAGRYKRGRRSARELAHDEQRLRRSVEDVVCVICNYAPCVASVVDKQHLFVVTSGKGQRVICSVKLEYDHS